MKKILALLLMLALLLPSFALAQQTVKEVRYSTDGGSTWKEDSLMNALWYSYNYQNVTIELLKNITLDSDWYAQQDLGYNGATWIIDGKGYTITRTQGAKMLFCVRYGSNVTLKNIIIDGGAVWSSNDPTTRVNTGLSLVGDNAHLIYVDGNATLTLEDGVILQNSDLGNGGYGAAVTVGYSDAGNGKLIMKDGVIIRNNQSESGGAVYIMGAGDVFEMQGGTFTGNYATGGGGAVLVGTGGTFVLKGGSLTGNASGNNGGGVTAQGIFNMEGGSIADNRSEVGGGGVTVLGGSVTLKGGSIKGNSVTGSLGGGVLFNSGNLLVEGNPIVTDNSDANGTSNIYLRNNTITVNGMLSGAQLGVTTAVKPTDTAPVNVTGQNSTDYSGAFRSDKPIYAVKNQNNVVQLEIAPTYPVAVANGTGSGNYAEGASVTITANEPEPGKRFKEWTGVENLTFTSGDASTAAATFIMPARNVSITAVYEDGGATGGDSAGGETISGGISSEFAAVLPDSVHTEIPQTDDSAPLEIWCAMAAVGVLGLGIAAGMKRRGRGKEAE